MFTHLKYHIIAGRDYDIQVCKNLKKFTPKLSLFNIQKTKIMTSGPITSWQIDGDTMETDRLLFSWAPRSMQMVTVAMKLKDICSLKEKL